MRNKILIYFLFFLAGILLGYCYDIHASYFEILSAEGYHAIVITQEYKNSAQFCARDNAENRVCGELNNKMEKSNDRTSPPGEIFPGNLHDPETAVGRGNREEIGGWKKHSFIINK